MNSPTEFYNAIQGILKSWTALQLAVSHGFGGTHSAEKAQWMVGVIENYFAENDNLEEWELEEFIAQIMSEEFDTVLEDGSVCSVTKDIFEVFRLWSQNKIYELHARIQALPQVNLAECIADSTEAHEQMSTLPEEVGGFASMSVSSTHESEDTKLKPAAEEEDGWTTVVTRSKTRKK